MYIVYINNNIFAHDIHSTTYICKYVKLIHNGLGPYYCIQYIYHIFLTVYGILPE